MGGAGPQWASASKPRSGMARLPFASRLRWNLDFQNLGETNCGHFAAAVAVEKSRIREGTLHMARRAEGLSMAFPDDVTASSPGRKTTLQPPPSRLSAAAAFGFELALI